MKIGILVYSQTGNTLSVAEQLQQSLARAGHTVALENIQPVGQGHPGMRHIEFSNFPLPDNYDAVVFAAPVQAFSLCAVMRLYLQALKGGLKGKKVACFTTEAFPAPWLGGNHAIRQMTRAITNLGGITIGSGVINWYLPDRPARVDALVSRLSALFK